MRESESERGSERDRRREVGQVRERELLVSLYQNQVWSTLSCPLTLSLSSIAFSDETSLQPSTVSL